MNKILRGIPVSDADNDSSRRPGVGYSAGLPPRATSDQDRGGYHENGGFVHGFPWMMAKLWGQAKERATKSAEFEGLRSEGKMKFSTNKWGKADPRAGNGAGKRY